MTASRRLAGAAVLAAMLSGWTPANAQTQAPSARDACRASVFSLCPWEAATMNRKAAKTCLMKNLARASPECQAAIAARKAQHPPPEIK